MLLKTDNLTKKFSNLTAVNDISLTINQGESLGLVGPSGCGKSTLARLVLGLIPPTSGSIAYPGITNLRKDAQLVFQDPQTSLNPRIKIGETLAEPSKIHSLKPRVAELLSLVKLPASYASRYPHELSGGERQRVGIARALASEPKFLVLDEPVSALDVSIQLDVLNLLRELKQKLALTYLFIAHDLDVVWFVCDRIIVMKYGQIVRTEDKLAQRC